MPRISSFYGIVIAMFYNDHLPAYFHAICSGDELRVNIDNLEVLSGSLPRRARAMVLEWAALHQDELGASWERARAHEPLGTIDPLP
jgi:Domain of unknown function (DUF4160)